MKIFYSSKSPMTQIRNVYSKSVLRLTAGVKMISCLVQKGQEDINLNPDVFI